MTKASDNAFPSVLIEEGTEPSAPAAGHQRVYIDSTTHHLTRTNSSGTETDIESAGSVPTWISDNFQPDAYPGSPNALDDEFEGGGAIDAKWTKVNDPSAGNALSQTVYAGFCYVGLPENAGTDNFDATVRLKQAAPTGTAAATYVAKVSIGAVLEGYQTDGGEFSGVWVYLGNSTNDEAVGMGIQFNIGSLTTPVTVNGMNTSAGTITSLSSTQGILLPPAQHAYVKLVKAAATAYTSAQTYDGYFSLNGIVWHHAASGSKTFTTACDEVGLFWRLPKPAQAGAPRVESVVDFFRRTV